MSTEIDEAVIPLDAPMSVLEGVCDLPGSPVQLQPPELELSMHMVTSELVSAQPGNTLTVDTLQQSPLGPLQRCALCAAPQHLSLGITHAHTLSEVDGLPGSARKTETPDIIDAARKLSDAETPIKDDLNLAQPGPETSESDFECAVCMMILCEPVQTHCRHTFCRICLARAHSSTLRRTCPLCRAPCPVRAEELLELSSLVPILQSLDPNYADRVKQAKEDMRLLELRQDVEIHLTQSLLTIFRGISSPPANLPSYEVVGAGTEAANGIYRPAVISSYRGPPLYRKAGTNIFIFRWRQAHWHIADLGAFQSRFSHCPGRFYSVSSGHPPAATPPESGWFMAEGGAGHRPLPTVHVVARSETRQSSRMLVVPDMQREDSNGERAATSEYAAGGQESVQVQDAMQRSWRPACCVVQ